jgi:hypothetical protein
MPRSFNGCRCEHGTGDTPEFEHGTGDTQKLKHAGRRNIYDGHVFLIEVMHR